MNQVLPSSGGPGGRALFIALGDLGAITTIGVRKKLHGQVDAARQLIGAPIDVVEQHGARAHVVINDVGCVYDLAKGIDNYHTAVARLITTRTNPNDYAMVYVRFPGASDLPFIKILRHFRGCQTVMEIPTYPINGERREMIAFFRRSRRWARLVVYFAQLMSDLLTRLFIRRYVSLIAFIGQAGPRIWGVPTLETTNGYPLANEVLPVRLPPPRVLNLVCVANVEVFLGLDRLIQGMSIYRFVGGQWKIHLDIVGQGSGLSSLKYLVTKLGLDDALTFHAPQTGDELRRIYQACDIGVSALALHRKGLASGSILKSREYCALGLPFIYAYNDPAFSDGLPFCLRLDPSDEPIQMESVISFFQSLDIQDCRQRARSYAEQHLTWEAVLQSVFAEIGSV